MNKSKVVWKVPGGYHILEEGSFVLTKCLIPFGGLESFTTEAFRIRNSDVSIFENNKRINPLEFAKRYADYMEADFYEIVNKPIHQPFEWEDDLKIQLYVINPYVKFSAEQKVK